MGFKLKNLFKTDVETSSEDEYYALSTEDALKGIEGEGTKLILLEPRAYSESQQIADHLKNRHTVVVNLKRVTTDQAKRIVDFLSGTIYAIGGDLQKIGGGIFLCTPKNMSVQGKISSDEDSKNEKVHDNSKIDIEW
jgi:FtsZ-interacting cell division protein YlmF